jgi:hypothetical protein
MKMAKKRTFGNEETRRARLEAVLRPSTDEAACQRCLDQLDAYIEAQLGDEDYLSAYPEVAVHLDQCPACADAYARLYDLVLADAADLLPQPANVPAPDLSFLKSTSTQQTPSLRQLVEQAISQVGNKLTFDFSAALLSLWQPPAPVAATRAADERYGDFLARLEPADVPGFDFPLQLTLFRDAQKADMILVEVTVTPPGRAWPNLTGSTVTLIVDETRREAVTDAWGLVAFEDVPQAALESLRVEVNLA